MTQLPSSLKGPLLETMLRDPNGLVAVLSPDGTLLEINETALQYVEASEEEVRGTPFWNTPWWPKQSRDDVREQIRQAEERGYVEFETGLIGPGDSHLTVQSTIRRVTDEPSSAEALVFTARDVTEQREREKELQWHKHFLEQTQRLAGAWEIDIRSGEVWASDKVYEIHEVEPGTPIQAEEVLEFYPEEARSEVVEAFETCVEEGAPYDLELPIDTAEGNRRWVRTVGAPVQTENGEARRIAGAFQDITQRKQRERELRQSQKRWRRLVERLRSGVHVSVDGTIQYVNPAAVDILGADSSEEIIGREIRDFVPGDCTVDVEDRFDTLRKGDPTEPVEHEMVGIDGTRRYIRSYSVPIELGEEQGIQSVVRDITEKREARGQLEERRKKVEALYEATRRLLTADGRSTVAERIHEVIDDVFDYAVTNTGFVEGSDIVPAKTTTSGPDLPEPTRQPLDGNSVAAQTLRAGETVVFDKVHALKNDVDYGPLQSAAGVPIGEYGIFIVGKVDSDPFDPFDLHLIDVVGSYAALIVERLTREEDLHNTRERMELTLKQTGSVVFEVDTGIGEVVRHGVFENFFGVPSDDISSWDAFAESLVHPNDQEKFRRFYRALEEGRQDSGRLEFRTSPQTGEVRWMRDTVFAEENEGRRWLRGLSQDITAEKRREQELLTAKEEAEESRTLFRSIFDLAPVMITLVDEEGKFERVNSHFEEVMGWSEEQLRQQNDPLNLFYPRVEERDRARAITREAQEEWYETRPQTKEGERIDTAWRKVELGHGRRLSIGVNITDQKERERKLREAKEEAEAASQAKSAFLANMSHEIRTPLTSVIGFAEALGKTTDGEEDATAQFAEMIEASGRRLLDTLDAVLQFSKLEAGEMELSFESVALAEEVAKTVEEFEAQAHGAGVELQLDTDPPASACVDVGGIQIALRNLVSNAIKYTEAGGTVYVRAWGKNNTTCVEIEDTGIGMDSEQVDELLEPFEQESEGLDREYEGTGLGLALTNRITQEMGGALDIETEKGEGTTVALTLPAPEAPTNCE